MLQISVAKTAELDDIEEMIYRIVLLAIAFAIPAAAQDIKPTEPTTSAGNWSKIGTPIDGSRGFTLYGRGIRLNTEGAYELWVKIVPANTAAFVKRYSLPKNTSYAMQFATINCSKKLLLLEKTTALDTADKSIEGNMSALTPASKRDSVRPGSIGDVLFRSVCDDPSAMPKSQSPSN